MDYSPLKIVGSAYLLRIFWSQTSMVARLAVLSDREDKQPEDEIFINCTVQDPEIFRWLTDCYLDVQQGGVIRLDFVAEYLACESQFYGFKENASFLNLNAKLISVQETFRCVTPKSRAA